MDEAAMRTEKAELERKLEARKGLSGYGATLTAMNKRLAEIEAELPSKVILTDG